MAKEKDIISIDKLNLTQDELKIFEERALIADTMKSLDIKEKRLSQQVKDIFKKYQIVDSVDVYGKKFTVSESTRKTIGKSDKDQFVSELINLNKKYLLTQSIDIDTDTLYEEYQNGTIDKSIVDKYMKITPIQKLTVS
jgi:hypothetical protein